MFKENFKNLYKRELRGAIIKALVYSLLISCSVLFVISFTFWVLNIEKYWIALIIFAPIEIAAFSLLFVLFKPNDTKIAKKLDSLGLAQRVITMYEYKDKDGLMAQVQRQNAIEHINKVNLKMLKVVIPVLVIVFTCVAFTLAGASTTVAALSSHGVIENGSKVIENIIPTEPKTYEIFYDVEGEGVIEGDMFQVVYEGEGALAVIAVPEEGWAFVRWSDGYEEPYREDLDIHENATFIATFMELELYESDEEGGGEPNEGEQSDLPKDMESQEAPSPDPSDDSGGGAGGMYEPNNQVIDGTTYYGGSTYDNAYGDAMNDLQNNNNVSDEGKDVIGDYYTNIEK